MLGEIIKSSEALRYHAKSAEITGQNLAHVDDENYARQRVLAREGLMYNSNGGLSTSPIEAGGLDHARNNLLDKRVFSEFGESANLKAQQEILTLLQAALGESIVRQNIDGSLDLENDSNLAEGGLARAVDDFFNSLQELSASPDEASSKQEVFQKLQTLTKRFNDAGEALQAIESDLTESIDNSINEVNQLLDKIYEVNLQIKRFELLGQGKAVTYRDNRQRLLEDLSKLINFSISPEKVNEEETGFLNLYTTGSDGSSIALLTADGAPQGVSQNFGKSLSLKNGLGAEAVVQAKISKEGTLGQVEVLDGGSQFDDTEGPILLSFSPPIIEEELIDGITPKSYAEGEVFSSGGKIYQVLEDTIAGVSIASDSFLELSNLPESGKPFPETLRRYSDLETFNKGEVVYYEGKVYQVSEDFGPTSKLSLDAEIGKSQITLVDYIADSEVQINGFVYKIDNELVAGSVLPTNLPTVQGESQDGFTLVGLPTEGQVVEEIQLQDALLTNRKIFKGEVLEYENHFFQVLKNVEAGTELSGLTADEFPLGQDVDGILISLGLAEQLPNKIDDLSYVPLVTNQQEEGDRWFLGKSYAQGDVVKFEYKPGEFTYLRIEQDIPRETEIQNLANTLQFKDNEELIFYTEDNPFDPDNPSLRFEEQVNGNTYAFTVIENPNKDYSFSNNSFSLSDVKLSVIKSKAHSIDEFKKNIATEGMQNPVVRFRQNEIYYYEDTENSYKHFVVTQPLDIADMSTFDPRDEKWENHFKEFDAQLVSPDDPNFIVRKSYPTGLNSESGQMVELNVGIAEAVIKKGEIAGFNILNQGSNLPQTDSIFVGDQKIELDSGKIKGYQDSRLIHFDGFRSELNNLVSTFAEGVNEIYNPDDEPGSYIFGFDAVLTRPISGRNLLMEEEYGYYGREGDANITLYRDEVDMTLPFAGSDEFSIVNTTPIFPEDFAGQTTFYRGGQDAETYFRGENSGDLFAFYGSARRMQNVTMEADESYPGSDLITGTEDDGRSLLIGYETIPFRIEGLEEGAKLPIIGDNYTFSALPANPWNLASSLRIDERLSVDNLMTGERFISGSNEIAQSLAEFGDGSFIEKVALLNSGMGSKLSDLSDNLDHQESIESLLLEQRGAVSSVNIDEEVANLMRFQRSFQASSRVLSTLDKMLEIVVMSLIR